MAGVPWVAVTVPGIDTASGMARMFADYLAQNFEDLPSKRRLMRFRLRPIVLTAADKGISITVRFAPRLVSVEDGRMPAALEFVGPFVSLTRIASAQPVSVRELGQFRARGVFRHPVAALLSALLLRTPRRLYKDPVYQRKV